jgi:hypothetical protein
MANTKKRIIIYIAIGLAIALAIGGVISARYAADANDPVKLLALGERFLLELDYEQAIVQFLKVIEIEPMNERAYLGAAEAYMGLGQTAEAIAILERGLAALPESAAIAAMLESLRPPQEPEPEPEVEPEPEPEPEPEAAAANDPANWTDLNGQPIFDADYVSNVLGLPAGMFTIYDIPGIDAEPIAYFEAGPHDFGVFNGFGNWGGGWGENGDGTYHFDINGEEMVQYWLAQDGTFEHTTYIYPEGTAHVWGLSEGFTPSDMIRLFRYENPETEELLKDPAAYFAAREPDNTNQNSDTWHFILYNHGGTIFDDGIYATREGYQGFIDYTSFPDGNELLWISYYDYSEADVTRFMDIRFRKADGVFSPFQISYHISPREG